MFSIESQIKNQFSKYFKQDDWHLFKKIAEYYLKQSVYLRKRNINFEAALKLLIRNVQKRLFIGIGVELLVKSFYLKNGYSINLIKNKKNNMKNFPFKLDTINLYLFEEANTFTLNDLLTNIHKVKKFNQLQTIQKGFKIAKVFRNKEGHVVTSEHKFDDTNYTDIEQSMVAFYKEAFNECLKIKFSIKPNEKPVWHIKTLT